MRSMLLFLLLVVLHASRSAKASDEGIFLLPYFLGNGETGIYFAASEDGLHFEWLNDGEVVMPAPKWEIRA